MPWRLTEQGHQQMTEKEAAEVDKKQAAKEEKKVEQKPYQPQPADVSEKAKDLLSDAGKEKGK